MNVSSKTILLILIASIGWGISGCRGKYAERKADVESETSRNTPPFLKPLPENFAADVVMRDTKGATRRYFVARSGVRSLKKFSVGTDKEVALLSVEGEFDFKLLPKEKKYVKLRKKKFGAGDNSFTRGLTHLWLNEYQNTKYTKLESKEGFDIYRVEPEGMIESEVLVFVDPKLGLPVKQEFYELKDKKKKLVLSVVFENISLAENKKLFEIPDGYAEESANPSEVSESMN